MMTNVLNIRAFETFECRFIGSKIKIKMFNLIYITLYHSIYLCIDKKLQHLSIFLRFVFGIYITNIFFPIYSVFLMFF
jgi:hypothetical protein